MQALNLTSNYPKLAFISRFLQKKTILIKPGLFFKKIKRPETKARPDVKILQGNQITAYKCVPCERAL